MRFYPGGLDGKDDLAFKQFEMICSHVFFATNINKFFYNETAVSFSILIPKLILTSISLVARIKKERRRMCHFDEARSCFATLDV